MKYIFKRVYICRKSLTRQKNQNKQLLRANDRLEKQKLSLEQLCNNLQQRLNEMQNALDKEKLLNKQNMIEVRFVLNVLLQYMLFIVRKNNCNYTYLLFLFFRDSMNCYISYFQAFQVFFRFSCFLILWEFLVLLFVTFCLCIYDLPFF